MDMVNLYLDRLKARRKQLPSREGGFDSFGSAPSSASLGNIFNLELKKNPQGVLDASLSKLSKPISEIVKKSPSKPSKPIEPAWTAPTLSLKPEIPEPLCIERFVAAVQTYWPGADTPPSIVKEEPFGLDRPPPLLKAAWLRLLEGRPEGVEPVTWETAVFDLALFFGDWGKLITDFRWMPVDVFGYPTGLAWSIKGSPVVSIGKGMAMMRDERIWKRQ
jgi:hypothetical protein